MLHNTKKQGSEWLCRLILLTLKHERTASRSVTSRAKQVAVALAARYMLQREHGRTIVVAATATAVTGAAHLRRWWRRCCGISRTVVQEPRVAVHCKEPLGNIKTEILWSGRRALPPSRSYRMVSLRPSMSIECVLSVHVVSCVHKASAIGRGRRHQFDGHVKLYDS